jgi:Tfp pilus assembly protein PilF
MKRRVPLAIKIVFLFIFAVFPARAAVGEWVSVRSKNFNLIGNASESDVRSVAARLEQFRSAFEQVSRRINFNSPIPTTVIVFKSDADYAPYKPVAEDGKNFSNAKIKGYFLSSRDANYITLAVGDDINEAFGTIFHEYTHFLLDNNIGRGKVPPWVNEGLAEYYQTFRIENGSTAKLGAVQSEHLRLLARSELMPAEKFFRMDNFTLHQQTEDGVGLFYAQAWALMHYLKHRKPLQAENFLNLLSDGKPAGAAFEEAFQIDFAAALDELKKYLSENNFAVRSFDLKNDTSAVQELKSAPLSDAAAKVHLAEVLTRFNRLTEAENHLAEVLRIEPESSPALVALGSVKLRRKNFAEAHRLFERAMKADDKNYLAFYNYAFAISREGMTDYGFVDFYTFEEAEKMRAALRRAIELKPDFAESYELFALVAIVRNEGIDQAVEFLKKALEIAPGNQDYQIRLAELYLWKEDFASARRLALNVVHTAADSKLKLYAENTLNKINSYEAQLEAVKRGRKSSQPEIPDRIFSEEELREIRERGFIEAINQLLTRPQPDEKRVLGYLTRIECRPGGIVYHVKVDDRTLKFQSKSFDSVSLVALNAEMFQRKLACGDLKESLAVVLYRPENGGGIAEVRAIEFVPANFKLLN